MNNIYITHAFVAIYSKMFIEFLMSYVGGMRASFQMSYIFNWISEGDIISSGLQFLVHSSYIYIYLFVESIGAWSIVSKSLDTEFHTAPFPAGHCQPYVT